MRRLLYHRQACDEDPIDRPVIDSRQAVATGNSLRRRIDFLLQKDKE
jgi:hypothetical protein